MHVTRSSKFLGKIQNNVKFVIWLNDPHYNPEWRVITHRTLEKVGKYVDIVEHHTFALK